MADSGAHRPWAGGPVGPVRHCPLFRIVVDSLCNMPSTSVHHAQGIHNKSNEVEFGSIVQLYTLLLRTTTVDTVSEKLITESIVKCFQRDVL